MNNCGSLDLSFFRDYLLAPTIDNKQTPSEEPSPMICRGNRLVIIRENETVLVITRNNE